MQRLAEIFTKSPLKVFAKSDIIIWVMRANMGKTPIIIEMSKLKESMKKQKITRRILAAFCVVCIALLQCFVLMPAASDGVHADAGEVTFRANYHPNDEKSIGAALENKTYITSASKGDTGAVDDEGKPIKGYILSSVLSKAHMDGKNVLVNGNPVSNTSKAWLVDDGNSWVLYDADGVYVDGVDMIEADLDKKPIEITDVSSSDSKPYKGDKVTIKYKLKVDTFFKNSDNYSDDALSLNWIASNGKISPESTTTNDTSGSFTVTVKESGEVTISPEAGDPEFSYLDGSKKVTLSGKDTKLTVKPSSVSLTVGESKTCTVKYNGKSVSNSECEWSSKPSSVATVSSGLIRGVKAGKATVTVKYNGKSATVSVTVKERKTSSTTRYTRSTYRPTYHTYRPTRSSNTIRTSGTGATRPTTATRPTETVSTAAPSFQTMKVKEVYLTPVEQDPYGGDEFGDEFTDDGTDENMDDENYDEDGVTFPAAAGSAAVAVAACGAGAVGRVRKFHIDMGDISSAKDIAAGGDGGMGGDGQSAEATGDAGEGEGKSSEKRSRNPLKKFRK